MKELKTKFIEFVFNQLTCIEHCLQNKARAYTRNILLLQLPCEALKAGMKLQNVQRVPRTYFHGIAFANTFEWNSIFCVSTSVFSAGLYFTFITDIPSPAKFQCIIRLINFIRYHFIIIRAFVAGQCLESWKRLMG